MAITCRFTYPGIQSWESISFTDISGIHPSVAVIEMYPQYGYPSLDGDLIFTHYDDETGEEYAITIRKCRIDAANFDRGSGGQVITLRIMDERWKWQFHRINGRYNFKLAYAYDFQVALNSSTQFVDPSHEKTPQELVKLCYKAMGYSDDDWDIGTLPNQSRPEVNWVGANPAVEIDKICEALGCRIVPIRSTGKWKIVVTGDGANLPDQWPYQDPSDGTDPIERPDALEILTADTLYECRLPLEPVGKDPSEAWYSIENLVFSPSVPAGVPYFSKWQWSDPSFYGISNARVLMNDGQTMLSPRELAQQTVFRCWRVAYYLSDPFRGGDNIRIPGLPLDDHTFHQKGSDLSRIILTDSLVQPFVEQGSTDIQGKPAFVSGEFWTIRKQTPGNYPKGSKIYRPAKEYKEGQEEDLISFAINFNDNALRSIIFFSQQLRYWRLIAPLSGGAPIDNFMTPANLFLTTAVKIRDKDTWQPLRKSFMRFIGERQGPEQGQDESKMVVRTYIKSDIQPWYRGVYDADGKLTETIDNIDSCRQRADYYFDAIVKTFEILQTSTRVYIGVYPIDMDGKIQQVTYRISKNGSDTIASTNSEHDWDIPDFESRRARTARYGPLNAQAVEEEVKTELRRQGFDL